VVLLAVTAVQLVALVRALVGDELPALGGGGLLLGFAVTVVWLLTIAWFTLGAWRRTVWGCPFAHAHDAPAARRCIRHALLDASAPAEPTPAEPAPPTPPEPAPPTPPEPDPPSPPGLDQR
jgi:hypothetical protein